MPTSLRVFEAKHPTALMPRNDVGQIDFSANGENFSLMMSRADFDRLGKRINALLRETPPPVRRTGGTPRPNGI